MKQLFTLSAAVLCSIGAMAQQAQRTNPLLPQRAKATPVRPTQDKTTAADSRPIAVSEFTYGASSFEIEDSTVLSYTGNNGWDYATQGWKFDTGTVWTYDAGTTSWSDDGGVKQVIANNRIMSSLFKSRMGSVWQDEQKSTYTYTGSGLIQTEEYAYNNGSGLEPAGRSTHTYNGDMQITQTVQDSWNPGSSQWEPSSRTINHYNTAKQMDTSWQQSWIAMTSQWMDGGRTISTYTNGKLMMQLQQNYSGPGWDDAYRSNYTYDVNGNMATVENEFWNNNAWEKSYRGEYTYTTAGDVATEIGAHWTGAAWENGNKYSTTYNQYRRPLTEESQTWNTSTSQWYYDSGDDYLTKYYYEVYTNDVKNVASNRTALNVFPVPAKEQITISASFQQSQPVSVVIRDMNGRVVKQIADQAGTQYRKAINVADLPAGNYMININGTTEVASKMISVTR
ncbi:T9SS type A sorting domain-containing protein [Polluticoccus soli]|uniref:T9SS type A sorting domain-containing protein n=1 Tax=Polluticoccus soli TaxID=3034150 RepID=UPI0023E27943|nr:T9SS type A sorting domain-containing protein [Flavipsychrobacter sp. JY13-12]